MRMERCHHFTCLSCQASGRALVGCPHQVRSLHIGSPRRPNVSTAPIKDQSYPDQANISTPARSLSTQEMSPHKRQPHLQPRQTSLSLPLCASPTTSPVRVPCSPPFKHRQPLCALCDGPQSSARASVFAKPFI